LTVGFYSGDLLILELHSAFFITKKQIHLFVILFIIVVALFIAMLFLNVYFRVKVFKVYKRLIDNRVEFGAAHLFNDKRMEEEVLSVYPQHKADILTFVTYIRYSMRMATVLIFLITMFGALLMYYR